MAKLTTKPRSLLNSAVSKIKRKILIQQDEPTTKYPETLSSHNETHIYGSSQTSSPESIQVTPVDIPRPSHNKVHSRPNNTASLDTSPGACITICGDESMNTISLSTPPNDSAAVEASSHTERIQSRPTEDVLKPESHDKHDQEQATTKHHRDAKPRHMSHDDDEFYFDGGLLEIERDSSCADGRLPFDESIFGIDDASHWTQGNSRVGIDQPIHPTSMDRI